MTIGRIDINEKDLPKICGAIIQLEEHSESATGAADITTAIAANTTPQGGRLTYVSTTALSFAPYGANKIKISGTLYTIPNAGIAGLANTSVFVNGAGSSNLAASTVYWVFAFINSGTVTADFRTAATHATSSTALNEGTEILTGDDSRTLIGMCRTNASSQFVSSVTQRFVTSWFNRRLVNMVNTLTTARTSASTSYVEIHSEIRCEFLIWSGDIATTVVNSLAYAAAIANGTIYSSIGFNGITAENCAVTNQDPGSGQPYLGAAAMVAKSGLTEGYNYATMLGKVNTGTGTWESNVATGLCSLVVICNG